MRVFNFAAGPAALPLEVLQQVREELTDWEHTGSSVMEVSHRSKAFIAVAEQAEADLRSLLDIPSAYQVLFLQGGASALFDENPIQRAWRDVHAIANHGSLNAWASAAHRGQLLLTPDEH